MSVGRGWGHVARAAAFVVPQAVAAVAIVVGMVIGDKIGVRMHGRCIFGGDCTGVDCLLLKEVSEERDLVVDCMGKALGLRTLLAPANLVRIVEMLALSWVWLYMKWRLMVWRAGQNS